MSLTLFKRTRMTRNEIRGNSEQALGLLKGSLRKISTLDQKG
jgi:hypothetical protein